MITTILFYIFATIAVVSALVTVFSRTPVTSAISLIVSLVALAPLFLQLGGHFVAVAQVLVYAGAIVVLFLFVIMLMDLKKSDTVDVMTPVKVKGLGIGIVLFLFLFTSFTGFFVHFPQQLYVNFGTVKEMGSLFTGRYIFLFEVITVLLTVSVLSVIALSKREVE